jgi:hypothetical protein
VRLRRGRPVRRARTRTSRPPRLAGRRDLRDLLGACGATAPRLSFATLKRLSFTHSTMYLILLVVWLVPGLHALEFVFGHGVAGS